MRREIPRAEWKELFAAFTREHQGRPVRLDGVARTPGGAPDIVELPLESVSLCPSGDEVVVRVRVGTGELALRLPSPERVILHRAAAGAPESLEIDSRLGEKALIRFRTTVPELVDGTA
jgi:hypothetical protein